MSTASALGLLAFTESAQKSNGASKQGKQGKGKAKPAKGVSRHAGGSRHKGKSAAIDFDEAARAEYLTGFQKRKAARKEAGRESIRKKVKEEQLATRKEAREAKKQRALENLKADRRAMGLPSDSETENDDPDETATVPQLHDETYDTDQHHTQVVVEEFDPLEEDRRQEEQEKRIVAMSKALQMEPKISPSAASATVGVEALPPSSAKANKANAKSGEEETDADPSQHEQDSTQKRLHISGLTESFTAEELKQRFATFGRVVALDEWPGPRSATGQLRPFAYLTIEATGPQVSRCINLLNGSMWKGTKLRVGEAKPDFKKRRIIELKRREEEDRNKPTKRKRLPGHIGLESAIMAPVTAQRVKEGLWGWKRTPAGHLVRPLHIRPEHPLPKPAPLKTKDGENVKGTRRPRANAVPPVRAKRVTIDPTRYGAIHITGAMLDGPIADGFDISALGAGEWQCEEINDPSDAAEQPTSKTTRLVRWTFVGKDGSVLHEEFANLPVRPRPSPAIRDAERQAVSTGAVPSFEPPTRSTDAPEETGSDTGRLSLDGQGSIFADAASDAGSDLFAGFQSSVAPEGTQGTGRMDDGDDVDSEDVTSEVGSDLFSGFQSSLPAKISQPAEKRSHSASVPEFTDLNFIVPKAPFDPDAESEFSDGYQEGPATGQGSGSKPLDYGIERDKTLGVLSSFFGSGLVGHDRAGEAPAPIYTPVVEDDDDIEDLLPQYGDVDEAVTTIAEAPLLQAAAKHQDDAVPKKMAEPESEDSQSVSSNSSSDLHSNSSRSASDSSKPPAQENPTEIALGNADNRMQRLTEMFKPQEDGATGKGFSLMGVLGDDLDLELDEDMAFAAAYDDHEDNPQDDGGQGQGLAGDEAAESPAAPSLTMLARGPNSWFDPNPAIPFLFPSRQSGPRSILNRLKDPQMAPLIAPSARRSALETPSAMTGANAVPVSSTTVAYKPFCRSETEAEMDELWASRRVRLTKEFKKMHREAVRKKRRRFVGSKRAAAAAAGGEVGAATASEHH